MHFDFNGTVVAAVHFGLFFFFFLLSLLHFHLHNISGFRICTIMLHFAACDLWLAYKSAIIRCSYKYAFWQINSSVSLASRIGIRAADEMICPCLNLDTLLPAMIAQEVVA